MCYAIEFRDALRPAKMDGLFCLTSRDVEALLVTRGVLATYEAIRTWCRKCGQAYTYCMPL